MSDTTTEQPKLTPQQEEVVRLVAEGLHNKEIAGKMGLSLRTVENHRYRALRVLGVKNTAQLVRAALRMGLSCL